MKILVSGSCGFVFSNFIIYAIQNTKWDFVSIDKLTDSGSLLNVPQVKRHKLYIGDTCDYHFVKKIFEIEKPDIVIHAAADDGSGQGNFVSTNIIGTHSLLEACVKTHCPEKFINISSYSVYGECSKEQKFSEVCALHPSNPHATSKASADLLGQSYVSAHSVPVITVRLCDIFGPRQNINKLIPGSVAKIFSGSACELSYGKNYREFMYVKDVFGAINSIIESGLPGEIYNVGSGIIKTNEEILINIFNILKLDPQFVLKGSAEKSDKYRALDSQKIKRLGWESQYNLEDALSHTIFWMKANTWFFKK